MVKVIDNLVDYFWFGSETKEYYRNKERSISESLKDDSKILEISLHILKNLKKIHMFGGKIFPSLLDIMGITGYISSKDPFWLYNVVIGEASRSIWDYLFYRARKRGERKTRLTQNL